MREGQRRGGQRRGRGKREMKERQEGKRRRQERMTTEKPNRTNTCSGHPSMSSQGVFSDVGHFSQISSLGSHKTGIYGHTMLSDPI